MIDFEPDEEQALIVETVRQFVENEIRPQARDCDESGKLPEATLAQAAACRADSDRATWVGKTRWTGAIRFRWCRI